MKTKNQIKIFIIEDNEVFALALKVDIENTIKMPILVYTFETGEACMEKFKIEKPQIVILDYHLNNLHHDAADGIKILDWIKKGNKDTHVIMLTGDDHIDIALKSFKHGASDYIVKTDTKFRKLIFSLYNLIKIMEAKSDAKRFKLILTVTLLGVAILIGGVIAIHIIAPFCK